MLSPVDAEGESKSSLTVQLNQRVAARMGCSPGGRQIKEGGHFAVGGRGGFKKGFMVYGGLAEALTGTESVSRCATGSALASPLKVPLSFGLSRTIVLPT